MRLMFNWGVRFKNKAWVIAFISQLMIVAQIVLEGLNILGWTTFRLTEEIQNEILMLVNSIFMILAMLGIIQDPTTKGYRDSKRAMEYKDPN
ncbi:phage holin [Mesobacillus jeotgali]|uniref:phage holin n=1 Tax=Mesobacillus jeotgali TaxID=129985 RepID=UPI00299E4DB9|nr:phage holin [Mesobacillus jeotgali]